MGGTGRRAFLLATSVACAGCLVTYHPTRPHEAADGGVAARVRTIDGVGNAVAVAVTVSAPPAYGLGDAWLTNPAAGPCSGGTAVAQQNPSALHAEDRLLAFTLQSSERADLEQGRPLAMDLDFVPGDPNAARRCLRVPLTDGTADIQWRAWPRWFAATGLRVILAPPSDTDPIRGTALFSLGGGVWVGPVRLRLDWLVGGAETGRPPPAGYGNASATLIGGDAAAEMFPIHLGRWTGIGVQLGYEYLATDFRSQQGSNESSVYDGHGPRGPRLALRIAHLAEPPVWPGFRARRDHWSMGIDLFVARWTGLPGLAPMRYGIAWTGEWGRWW